MSNAVIASPLASFGGHYSTGITLAVITAGGAAAVTISESVFYSSEVFYFPRHMNGRDL